MIGSSDMAGRLFRCGGVGCKDKGRDEQTFIGDKRATIRLRLCAAGTSTG
jgi:hypothetical protein